jgi:hypothetical protein
MAAAARVDVQAADATRWPDCGLSSFPVWGLACALWPAGGRGGVVAGGSEVDEAAALLWADSEGLSGAGTAAECGYLALYARFRLCSSINGLWSPNLKTSSPRVCGHWRVVCLRVWRRVDSVERFEKNNKDQNSQNAVKTHSIGPLVPRLTRKYDFYFFRRSAFKRQTTVLSLRCIEIGT